MPLPSISVDSEPDVILGLPLGDAQAKFIIDSSTRAPCGKGEETTSDHNTWQLDPTLFSINNSEWSDYLRELLQEVKAQFGCSKKVTCELHKLFLYQPGGLFEVSRLCLSLISEHL